jgi:hypothetical protein
MGTKYNDKVHEAAHSIYPEVDIARSSGGVRWEGQGTYGIARNRQTMDGKGSFLDVSQYNSQAPHIFKTHLYPRAFSQRRLHC